MVHEEPLFKFKRLLLLVLLNLESFIVAGQASGKVIDPLGPALDI